MKNKKTELMFVPLSEIVSEPVDPIILTNCESLRERGLSVKVTKDPVQIIATFEEEIPEIDGSCRLNASIDDRLLFQMRIKSAKVTYTGALLPLRSKAKMIAPDGLFCVGKSNSIYNVYSPRAFIVPTITCRPSQKIVEIFLNVSDGDYEWKNFHRIALLNTELGVEKVIMATKCAEQLVQAFRTSPRNRGFIERSIKELYASIGVLCP